ncbi:hypothetical protein ANN_11566 [Periplaneta americana]|uniref:Uncharacterized protein n=1 Tax=Periplaneta americana TaxID=6978 RepID=A0ABQ8T6X1_PERAM|nr:hypothetical protein ANN_11566 [Periplaneta americana]
MERVKWTDRIRNEAVPKRVDEERIMLKLIWKTEGCAGRNDLGCLKSVRCLSRQLQIPKSTVFKVLKFTLKKRAYHLQVLHQLHEEDLAERMAMCIDLLDSVETDDLMCCSVMREHFIENIITGACVQMRIVQGHQWTIRRKESMSVMSLHNSVYHFYHHPTCLVSITLSDTDVAQSAESLACRSGVAFRRGFDSRLG